MWLLDLVGGGGFVRVSVTVRFEGVAEVVVISTVGIDERVLVNWSCSLVKTKSVGYELGGGSNTLLREVPGTRALSITPWIPLAGIPASSSKDFSASTVNIALTSTPGKVEIAPSLGHRACFMHCMSVIIMAQLERWPSSARTSINAWSMRMHWSSTLEFFLLLFSPITLNDGGV